MGRPTESVEVNDSQRRELERMINAPTSPQRLVLRARIVLARAQGLSQKATVTELDVSRPTVIRWERRFAALGVQGLVKDAPGRGPKPSISEAKKNKLITQATQPPPNRTRWSVRSMARQVGVSPASVQRIWAANDIKPHLTRTFKLSRDPNFETKFWDVIPGPRPRPLLR
jgi:transposase